MGLLLTPFCILPLAQNLLLRINTTIMSNNYIPVYQNGLNAEETDVIQCVELSRPSTRWRYGLLIFSTALLSSLCVNVFFIYRQFFRPWELDGQLATQFGKPNYYLMFLLEKINLYLAGLHRDINTEILSSSDFDSMNRTVQDAAWDRVDIEPWNGFVALDEDYTIMQGLPHSQRWPWDLSKGVYILTSSHELHCVVSLTTVNSTPAKERRN
jgi:hypothetical protein